MPISKVFVSTGAVKKSACLEVDDTLLANDIKNIELTAGMVADSLALLELGALAEKNSATFLVHNYFPPPPEPFVLNLASNNGDVLNKSREHCKRAIELSSKLGAKLYTVHSGFCLHAEPKNLGRAQIDLPSIPRPDAEKNFIESLKELALFGKKYSVEIAIENNVVTEANGALGAGRYIGVFAEEILGILEKLEDFNVGLLLDVGHLKVSALTFDFDPSKFIQQTAHKIKALHLSDNDGRTDSNGPLSADSWFWKPLKEFLSNSVPCVLEVYNQSQKEIKQQVQLINSNLNLMES